MHSTASLHWEKHRRETTLLWNSTYFSRHVNVPLLSNFLVSVHIQLSTPTQVETVHNHMCRHTVLTPPHHPHPAIEKCTQSCVEVHRHLYATSSPPPPTQYNTVHGQVPSLQVLKHQVIHTNTILTMCTFRCISTKTPAC